jgi:CheY-like chemotaxis protein/HPt (histidine-containing phosphotransfer) domain-containing protein
MAPNPSGEVEPPLNARVLLAEDNPIDRLVLHEMLEQLGCRADIVADGGGVVEMLATGAYALVLMDIRMPVMDGFLATEEIREFERTQNTPRRIPIIALTADALGGTPEKCLDAGMDGCLIKPVTLMQLRQALESWLIQDNAPIRSRGTAGDPESASVERDAAALETGPVLLDRKALDNIRAVQQAGAPNVLDKIIKIYFDNSPQLLQALRDAVAEDNAAEAIGRAAHSLKSSSANLGATRLAALCRDLEEMARDNCTTGAGAILSEIEALYPLVCESLAAECETAAG